MRRPSRRRCRLLHSFTIGYVGMEIGRRTVEPARYEEFDPRQYPTRAALATHLGPFGEAQFETALDVIVRGIEAMAAQPRAQAKATRAGATRPKPTSGN